MRKNNFWILTVVLSLVFAACGEDKNESDSKAKDTENNDDKEMVCLYSYDNKGSSAKWEAYKTNERIGVKGEFKSISLGTQVQSAENLNDLFAGAAFKAITNSVSTGDASRDKKIVDFFFGNLDDGAVLTGSVISVQGDAKSGIMQFDLSINRVKNVIDMPYKVDENNVLSGEFMINIDDYRGQPAIESLNRECNELHTGADGISKLWPDVKVILSTQLGVDCR